MQQSHAAARIQTVIDECLPLLKALAKGRGAVTIGGSHAKGTFDDRSDIDFRAPGGRPLQRTNCPGWRPSLEFDPRGNPA